jgi:hypothetical protein
MTGNSSRAPTSKIPVLTRVSITSVDAATQTAYGTTRTVANFPIDTSHYVGATQVTPVIGEQWYAATVEGVNRLHSRIPYNDPNQLAVTPTPGQHVVGSGQGPVELQGTQINVNANMRLGSTLYRDTGGVLESSTDGGTTWGPVATGGVTISTAWDDLTGVPSTFPPTTPIPWSDLDDTPATFPPTLPSGTGDTTTFWRGDDTWAVPPGGGGAGGLVVGHGLTTDGTTTTFTLPEAFTSNSTMVYVNGLRQLRGTDYTEGGTTQIVFSIAPATLDVVMVDFVIAGVGNNLVSGEVPSGAINGTNATLTLANTFIPDSTSVFQNGLREQLGVGYTEATPNEIVFSTPPPSGDLITVDYLLSV